MFEAKGYQITKIEHFMLLDANHDQITNNWTTPGNRISKMYVFKAPVPTLQNLQK